MTDMAGFLAAPPQTPEVERLFEEDIAEDGYVMNLTRLWAYQPETINGLFALQRQVNAGNALSVRQRYVLVTAFAGAFGDTYCALAWAERLAGDTDAETAAAVLRGTDEGLSDSERALARWARAIARDPSATTPADVQALRDVGFTDAQIFAMTTFVALRLAFSTVNDALGAMPDAQLRDRVPPAVLAAVPPGRDTH